MNNFETVDSSLQQITLSIKIQSIILHIINKRIFSTYTLTQIRDCYLLKNQEIAILIVEQIHESNKDLNNRTMHQYSQQFKTRQL